MIEMIYAVGREVILLAMLLRLSLTLEQHHLIIAVN